MVPLFRHGRHSSKALALHQLHQRPQHPVRRRRNAQRLAALHDQAVEVVDLAVLAYVSLTPDAKAVFEVKGFADWWARVQALKSFQTTQPG